MQVFKNIIKILVTVIIATVSSVAIYEQTQNVPENDSVIRKTISGTLVNNGDVEIYNDDDNDDDISILGVNSSNPDKSTQDDSMLARDSNNPPNETEGNIENGHTLPESFDYETIFDKRIIAFYGNFYSTRMGILGEFPEDVVIDRLMNVTEDWEVVDPTMPVLPAIHYIASTAQPTPTSTGTYTQRMPSDHILRAIAMSAKIGGITILDLQPGQADVLNEVKNLERYLKLPNVHLGIDPEFVMRDGHIPGEYIGTIDASEINDVSEYLMNIVQNNNLPPKVLLIHRFTKKMVTNVESINQSESVRVIIEMDGWGSPELKFSTYQAVITSENIPYSGLKIFYKNDLKPPSERLVTPREILQLTPQPIYIQYQ